MVIILKSGFLKLYLNAISSVHSRLEKNGFTVLLHSVESGINVVRLLVRGDEDDTDLVRIVALLEEVTDLYQRENMFISERKYASPSYADKLVPYSK